MNPTWLKQAKRMKERFSELRSRHPRALKVAVVLLAMLSMYAVSKSSEAVKTVVHIEREGEFQGKKIMGDAQSSVYEARERTLNKTASELLTGQKKLSEDVQKLTARVAAVEATKAQADGTVEPSGQGTPSNAEGQGAVSTSPMTSGQSSGQAESYQSERIAPNGRTAAGSTASSIGLASGYRTPARGPDVVTFPVASEDGKEELGITLPVGSYVKAKIIAGTDATTGEPDPVLLQLDYSNVLPNQRKVDLSGCFMTAKAQADLSTERVKMKTMKLSCVSKRGLVFERTVNGYVADDTDNKFAVSGPVNSKQDRVAAMAFLASVVEGVGKAVQQAQSTQQTTALGGSQSVMTGDERKYLAGGAAANAAGVVAQWYLKQAESLLPSITVGSGRDVWVVVLDNVILPNDYFTKGTGNDARYSYVTRVLD